jgi:hypothetical protein
MTGSDQPDWSEIRRLYLEGELPVAAIAKRHGVSVRRIYQRGSREGWPGRNRDGPPLASDVRPLARSVPAADAAARSLNARRALVRRLYKAIDTKLQQMERRMAHDMATDERSSDATAADHERDTRAIGALIANHSRVTEIEADLERLPGTAKPADRQLADEAERFRREVAERLARLVRPAGG